MSNSSATIRSDCSFQCNPLLPYRLQLADENKGAFYTRLDDFTQLVVLKGLTEFLENIRSFRQSPVFMNDNLSQSHEENLLDLLIIGTLWNEYGHQYRPVSKAWALVFQHLIRVRSNSKRFKKQIDVIRGQLGKRLLADTTNEFPVFNSSNLHQLTRWLEATGDFHEEAKRMVIWNSYFKLLSKEEFNELSIRITQFASWFKKEAQKHLGMYTPGVESFLSVHHENYVGRENYFFTGRSETEYHLNMVGAAIMNRNLKPAFDKTGQKILMLPSCMVKNQGCRTRQQGQVSICQHCTPDCPVSQISKAMNNEKVNTIVVQHSSDFSSAVKQWAGQTHTGLIGTACVLNLLEGGFEMKKNNIPSQCIFLDHSCCQKHWGIKNAAASIDEKQLHKIIDS
jgi:uncharacterized protein